MSAWCRDAQAGDLATCAFRLMPALLAATGEDRAARPLAVAWVSASCGRHGGYLEELRLYMPVDMLGACHRSRDELGHPGLRLAALAPLLPAGGAAGLGRGERKVVLGSLYRFYIGVENTVAAGYVTEKFFQVCDPDAASLWPWPGLGCCRTEGAIAPLSPPPSPAPLRA